MIQLHIQDSRHDFKEKPGSCGTVYICQYCKLRGLKPYSGTEFITIEGLNSEKKIDTCTPVNPKFNRPVVVMITEVDYTRLNMRSLKPGTLHDVLPMPQYANKRFINYVWVLGDKNKVVCLYPGEYTIIQQSKINSKSYNHVNN